MCASCGGSAANLALLRVVGAAELARDIWASSGELESSSKACPSCTNEMGEQSEGTPRLDLCVRCQLVWFDGGELSAAGVTLERTPPPEVVLALTELEQGARTQSNLAVGEAAIALYFIVSALRLLLSRIV